MCLYTGFNIAALEHMLPSLLRRDLVGLCRSWGITHDVGLGVYTWTKGMSAVRFLQDSQNDHRHDVMWHKPRQHEQEHEREYDRHFADIWSHMTSPDTPFNMSLYVSLEEASGQALIEALPPLKMSGIYNTLLYRKRQARKIYQSQIQSTATLSASEAEDEQQDDLDLVYYSSKDCQQDYTHFAQWVKASKWYISSNNWPLDTEYSLDKETGEEDEPLMCLDYAKHMSNLQFDDADLLTASLDTSQLF